jgi:hypothetical protein
MIASNQSYTYPCEHEIPAGVQVDIYVDDVLTHTVTSYSDSTGTYVNPSPDLSVNIDNNHHSLTIYNNHYTGLVKIVAHIETGELKKLDEKYLPDSVMEDIADARTVADDAKSIAQKAAVNYGLIASCAFAVTAESLIGDVKGYSCSPAGAITNVCNRMNIGDTFFLEIPTYDAGYKMEQRNTVTISRVADDEYLAVAPLIFYNSGSVKSVEFFEVRCVKGSNSISLKRLM